jgi:hypothetical protein
MQPPQVALLRFANCSDTPCACLLLGMPLQKDVIPPRVAREAANAEELRLMINAAYIAGLPPCQVRRP